MENFELVKIRWPSPEGSPRLELEYRLDDPASGRQIARVRVPVDYSADMTIDELENSGQRELRFRLALMADIA